MKKKIRYFKIHLNIAVAFIMVLGIFGILIGERSPHPKAMLYFSVSFFVAKIASCVVGTIYNLYFKGRSNL